MSSFWLEIAQQGQTQQFSFDSSRVSIGRDKASDFIIDHPTVSRQHGMITFDNQGFRLVVLSRGGMTAIDGQQVQGEVPLYDGTQVHFGSQCFTFRSHSAPPSPQPQQQQNWNQGGNASSGSWDAQPAPGNGTSGSWDAQPAPGNGTSGSWDAQPAPGSGTSGSWQNQAPADQGWNPGWDDQAGGNEGWQSPQEQQSSSDSDFMTWGDIAAKAEPLEQKKPKTEAPKQPKKTSPMLILALVGAVGFMGYAFVKPMLDGGGGGGEVEEKINPTGVIELNVECVGEASCRSDAINAFKVGQAAAEKVQADITNLYEAHYQFSRATALLEKGGITELPADLAEMEDLHRPVKKELAKLFQQERVKYLDAKKKKDKHRMKSAVKTVMAYVPDSACDYHKWAEQEKDWMQDKNAWPPDVDEFGNPISH